MISVYKYSDFYTCSSNSRLGGFYQPRRNHWIGDRSLIDRCSRVWIEKVDLCFWFSKLVHKYMLLFIIALKSGTYTITRFNTGRRIGLAQRWEFFKKFIKICFWTFSAKIMPLWLLDPALQPIRRLDFWEKKLKTYFDRLLNFKHLASLVCMYLFIRTICLKTLNSQLLSNRTLLCHRCQLDSWWCEHQNQRKRPLLRLRSVVVKLVLLSYSFFAPYIQKPVLKYKQ